MKTVSKILIVATIVQVQFVCSNPNNNNKNYKCDKLETPIIPNEEIQAEFKGFVQAHFFGLITYIEGIKTGIVEVNAQLRAAITIYQDGSTDPCYLNAIGALVVFDTHLANLNTYKLAQEIVWAALAANLPPFAALVDRYTDAMNKWVYCLNQIVPTRQKGCKIEDCKDDDGTIIPYISPQCLATLQTSTNILTKFTNELVLLFINSIIGPIGGVTKDAVKSFNYLLDVFDSVVSTMKDVVNCAPNICSN